MTTKTGDHFEITEDRLTSAIFSDGHLHAGGLGTEADARAQARQMLAASRLADALKRIAELGPAAEPDEGDYDDMDSAHTNGYRAGTWEAANIARAALADAAA